MTDVRLAGKSDKDLLEIVRAANLLAAAKEARTSFRAFVRFMMPDPDYPEDATKTEYRETPAGQLLCEIVEGIDSGKKRREAISIAPQTGKTMHLSELGTAWLIGRNKRRSIILATYNQIRANEIGGKVRDIIGTTRYGLVFEDLQLHPDFQAKDHLQTTAGGKLTYTGKGGSITGKRSDIFLVDDPIKGDEDESDTSPQALERLWKWFFKVAYSRGHKKTAMAVVHTRWEEDDLIGRLCDPNHPERHKRFEGVADDWNYLNVPGIVTDPGLARALGLKLVAPTDPKVIQIFGDRPMTTLDSEKSLSDYAQWKRGEPRTFSALVMGEPAPEDGAYFKANMLLEYGPNELPANLRIYSASDHAVSLKRRRDYTVIGAIGVDEQDNVWVLPDLFWDRAETDKTVEAMLDLMRRRKPLWWRLESELISKSFGPFLLKRMHEERIYTTLVPVTPSADKETRARAIQGRISHGKVRFPRFAPWWLNARAQMLRFPHGAHDDFVDFMAHVGAGLLSETGASAPPAEETNVIEIGSIEWVKAASLRQERMRKMRSGAL